jgi:hypothetical protein
MSFIKLSSESALLIEFRVNPCVKYSFVHRRVGGGGGGILGDIQMSPLPLIICIVWDYQLGRN